MKLTCLQHVPFEGPALVGSWAAANHIELQGVALYDGQDLPRPDDVDGLVVMGGPMGVNDRDTLPWMPPEMKLIADTIARHKPVLGICLGAQLIAAALGASVYPNPKKEIGWHPVEKTAQANDAVFGQALSQRFTAFHWHGDTFDLPQGAVHLAQTHACRNQAFALGDTVLGLQFHLEVTAEGADALIDACGDELAPSHTVQSATEIRAGYGHIENANVLMAGLLGRLFKAGR